MPTNQRSDVFTHYNMQANRPDGCWPWSGPVGGRSSEPRPYYQAEGKRYIAYRLVYELVHGITLARDQLIIHNCDNGSMPVGCGNPTHLSIGTVQQNSDDMTNRQRHGINHHMVKNIRKLLAEDRTQQEIADLYGVSRETVSAIATERSHSHVTKAADINTN